MKKGFMFALMMMAMVALVVSAYGNAPLISPLDEIIVGNLGDEDGANSLLRYNDAVNLDTAVDWNNPSYPYDKFHVYIYNTNNSSTAGDGVTQASIYNMDGYTAPLTTTEFTLLSGGGDADVSSLAHDGVTSTGGSFKMGLLEDYYHSSLADPYGATAAANGVAIPSDYNESAAVTLVAGVSSGTQGMITDTEEFTVLFQAGAEDGGGGSSYDFTANASGWVYVQNVVGVAQAPQYSDFTANGRGIGFNLGASPLTAVTYASWESPYDFPAEVDGGVYKVTASLNTDQATRSPGYRMNFANIGWVHYGELFVVPRGDDVSNANYPTDGAPLELRLYLRPPVELALMGPSDKLATENFGDVLGDRRQYKLIFDCLVLSGSNDQGILAMSSVNVAPYTPGAGTAALHWGGQPVTSGLPALASPTAFNATTGWADASSGVSGGNAGSVTVGANTISMALADGTNSFSYVAISPSNLFDAGGALEPVSDTLYCLVFEASTSDAKAFPSMRVAIDNVVADNSAGTVVTPRSLGKVEIFGGGLGLGVKNPWFFSNQTSPDVLTAAPGALSTSAAAPSVIYSYIYSQGQPTIAAPNRVAMVPIIDLVDNYLAGFGTDGHGLWPFPNATVTVGYAAWVDLGAGN